MSETSAKSFKRILNPMDRISEVMFGLIMALTFTCTLGVATADNIKVKTMLIGALGCNLAWGIIDAGIYLSAKLHEKGRNILMLRAMREAPDLDTAQRSSRTHCHRSWHRYCRQSSWSQCGKNCISCPNRPNGLD